jgi:hypothetical protein
MSIKPMKLTGAAREVSARPGGFRGGPGSLSSAFGHKL